LLHKPDRLRLRGLHLKSGKLPRLRLLLLLPLRGLNRLRLLLLFHKPDRLRLRGLHLKSGKLLRLLLLHRPNRPRLRGLQLLNLRRLQRTRTRENINRESSDK